MKIFVTQEYMQSSIARIKQLEAELDHIRKEKNNAFEGDTNSWHDNFAYESLTREEKLAEDKLFKAVREMDNYRVFADTVPANPKIVGIFCWVKVLEENLANLKQQEKTIGLVPLGGEDYKNKINEIINDKERKEMSTDERFRRRSGTNRKDDITGR